MTCTLCHPAGSTISPNTFGAHFRAASMVVTTTIPIRSAAQLTMVFQNTTFINTDSDGDGFDNRSEFVANTVPSSNLSFPGSGATTTTTTTTTTTRIQFPTGGAVASASPDPKGNALSGGCSGGRQQAMIEGPERGERAMVWLGLCVLPMLGLAFRRKE